MQTRNRWLAAIGLPLILTTLAVPVLPMHAQTQAVLNTVAGDVLFMDPATQHPFMWLHAKTGRMELLPGYNAEDGYRLLLQREQACWDVTNDYMRRTQVQTVPHEAPGPVRAK